MKKRTAIIIGAGPAGLTAAYELLARTDIKPIILESTYAIGGISRTVNYKGNRIDIGGHRFFSKSDVVMQWWQNIMPLEGSASLSTKTEPDLDKSDLIMLVRSRLSRIFFLRKFFPYPLSLDAAVLVNLGLYRVVKVAVAYLRAVLFPIRPEKNLEDFFVNRFGRELYATFFRDYTEKVWGVPCHEISADWGAQRIKGLSIVKSIIHAVKKIVSRKSLLEGDVETSLIEQFWYPKLGPGQLWEEVARRVEEAGGKILLGHEVIALRHAEGRISSVKVIDAATGAKAELEAEFFLSSMPVKDLILAMQPRVPQPVEEIAAGLMYRDFITVGLLVKKLIITDPSTGATVSDNWIYIQEQDVKIGRLQIFNNWSPYLVNDPDTVWLGLEYFCSKGDSLWSMVDEDLRALGIAELSKIAIISPEDVMDSVVIRVPKAYPAYFGSYDQFDLLRAHLDKISNMYLIGRNGMHKYNNADHSMLTSMAAVTAIETGNTRKDAIWAVNAEEIYQEQVLKK